MNVTDKNSIITRDDVYSYADAMQVMSVSHGTLYGGITNGLLHPVLAEQIYGMHGKKKYLLKEEIDPLHGIGTLRRDVVEFVRRNSAEVPAVRINTGGSLDYLSSREISAMVGSGQVDFDKLLDWASRTINEVVKTLAGVHR